MSADDSLSAYLQYFFSRYLPNLRGLPPTCHCQLQTKLGIVFTVPAKLKHHMF